MKGLALTGNVVGIAFIIALQLLNVNSEITRAQKLIRKSAAAVTPGQDLPRTNATSLTLSEGEQIALEVTHQLLPPPELSQKITQELKLIRYKYREVSQIFHQRKWIPGEVISTRVTAEQIRQVNSSEAYGPLLDATTIDLLPFYIVTFLSFAKPYNPLALGELLKFRYGFSSSPNTVYWDGNDLFYDPSSKTYIFKRVGCEERSEVVEMEGLTIMNEVIGCVQGSEEDSKHYWEFVVSDEGVPKLVKEYDIDGDGNKQFNRKYETII